MGRSTCQTERPGRQTTQPRSNCGHLDGCRGRPLGGECAVDLIDRAAARLEADEQDRYKREDIPGGEEFMAGIAPGLWRGTIAPLRS
jgi:hypothetical protein